MDQTKRMINVPVQTKRTITVPWQQAQKTTPPIQPFYFTPTNQWPWSTGGTVETDSGVYQVSPYSGSSRRVWDAPQRKAVTPFMSGNRPTATARDNSAVVGGWDVVNTLPQWQDAWLPAPTVATPQNPVILRNKTKVEKDVWYTPIDATDVEQMDLKQLRDFERSIKFDINRWVQPSKEMFLKLGRAEDRLRELSAPQSQVTTTAMDQLEQGRVTAKDKLQTELQAQDAAVFESQKQLETERLQAIQNANAKAEEKQRNTLGYILGWQGAATSSYWAEKLNEISSYFAEQNQLAIAESYANLEKLKAEQAGATRQELAKYDEQIFNIQTQKAQYQVEAAMKVDEYNREQALWLGESIQWLMDVAMAQEMEAIPLSDAEKALVDAYWQLIIDDKGNINKDLLDKLPARLKNQIIIKGAAVKGALPKEPKTINTDWGTFVYDYANDTRKKLAGSEKEQEWKWTKLDEATLFNSQTGETRTITGEWSIQTAIQKAIEVCGDAAQCGRFINEVGKQAGVTLWIGDSYESKVNAINKIWQAMNFNEIWAGSIFAYPTWTQYWHIGIITGVNPDGTVNLMDYNYNEDEKRRERMNVDPREILNMNGAISKPIITNEIVPQAAKPLTDKEFTQSNQVISSFKSDPQVKAFEEAYSNWLNLLSSLNDATWPWDVSAIFQFMKTLDPQSVVREAEFETAAKSAWVFQYIGNAYDRLTKWEKLSDSQRKAFGTLAKQFIANRSKIYLTKYEDWIRRLEKQWIDTSVFPTNIAQELEQYLWWQQQTNESDPLWLFQ